MREITFVTFVLLADDQSDGELNLQKDEGIKRNVLFF